MRTLAIATSVGAILLGAHSNVYACGDKAKAETAQAKAVKPVVWYAADAGTAAPKVYQIETKAVCKTVEAVAPIEVEVEVPGEALNTTRVIHVRGTAIQIDKSKAAPANPVEKTVRVAATLGRALVTTVGAVWGSLIDAAVSATAPWV
jgi:hypothetical protein